jgi:hypothetical protein
MTAANDGMQLSTLRAAAIAACWSKKGESSP